MRFSCSRGKRTKKGIKRKLKKEEKTNELLFRSLTCCIVLRENPQGLACIIRAVLNAKRSRSTGFLLRVRDRSRSSTRGCPLCENSSSFETRVKMKHTHSTHTRARAYRDRHIVHVTQRHARKGERERDVLCVQLYT